ncbi:MAG: TIGR01620 family protein [Pseudomonadota bacterium]
MTDDKQPRKPRAFKLHETDEALARQSKRKAESDPRKPKAQPVTSATLIEPETDPFQEEVQNENVELIVPPRKKRFRLFGWIVSILFTILSIAFGLWLEQLVITLFERNPLLGWGALGLIGLLALLVLIVIIREITAIMRLKSIASLHSDIRASIEAGDDKALKKAANRLEQHYILDPRTAVGREKLRQQSGEVIDGADRIILAEKALLSSLDDQARDIVMQSARRVSVVTAVSPRAFVDIAYVLFENVRLIRVLSEHYGGRSGGFGTLRLLRSVLGHLAVTGTVAVGDTLVQQLLGQGIASRVSTRLGEGVINGIMTVRIGISAMDVCRPAPFHALERPRVTEFLNVLAKFHNPATEDVKS